jgi:hypothetical protein
MCGIVAKPARTAIALIWVGAGLNSVFAFMCGIMAKPARTAIALIWVRVGLNGDFALVGAGLN